MDKIGSGTYGHVYQIFAEGWSSVKAAKKFKKIYSSKAEALGEMEARFL